MDSERSKPRFVERFREAYPRWYLWNFLFFAGLYILLSAWILIDPMGDSTFRSRLAIGVFTLVVSLATNVLGAAVGAAIVTFVFALLPRSPIQPVRIYVGAIASFVLGIVYGVVTATFTPWLYVHPG